MSKYIFSFGDKKNKKILNSKEILGGKGANLAEMARLGFQSNWIDKIGLSVQFD